MAPPVILADNGAPMLDVPLTFGAILLGTCVGLMLYGMTVHQVYRYFYIYRTDAWILKLTVLGVFLADSVHSLLCVHMCCYYLVHSRADQTLLQKGVWSLRMLAPATQTIVTVVQGFYLRRIRLLGKSCITQSIVLFLMLGTIAATIFMTVKSFEIPGFAEWAKWAVSRPSTDSLLKTLIVYTMNTGLLMSTLSILSLIFAVMQPHMFIYIALNMPTAKSYVNSMLAVLNSRRALAHRACTTSLGCDLEHIGSLGMSTPASTPCPRSTTTMAYDARNRTSGASWGEGSSAFDFDMESEVGNEGDWAHRSEEDGVAVSGGVPAAYGVPHVHKPDTAHISDV
ncbi:hypothetical protein C8Q77DRAFT_1159590 [Trametes polyzona]|nr:hypothetical protein C8Q77DRAFT_1159590 [Trametes polyzona]